MEMKQEWLSAVDRRTSRRTYLPKAVGEENMEALRRLTDRCNEEGDLSIRVMESGAELFRGFTASYGMLRGVPRYFAMIGKRDLPYLAEKLGYYGELLVLEAVSRGLGTCWIGGTYRRGECERLVGLKNDEELLCVIPFGVAAPQKTLREKLVALAGHAGQKQESWEAFITPHTGLPRWAVKGMEAVVKAPSAMNRRPARFTCAGDVVKASVPDRSSVQGIDLGIARAFRAWRVGCRLAREMDAAGRRISVLRLRITGRPRGAF